MNYFASRRNPDSDLRTMKMSDRYEMRNLADQTDLRWNLSGKADLRRQLSERNDSRRNLFEEDLRMDFSDREGFRRNSSNGDDLRLYLSNRDDLRRNLSERRSQRTRSNSRERWLGMGQVGNSLEHSTNFRNDESYFKGDRGYYDNRQRGFSSGEVRDRQYEEHYQGPLNVSKWGQERSPELWKRNFERDRRCMDGEKFNGLPNYFSNERPPEFERQNFHNDRNRDWQHSEHKFHNDISNTRRDWQLPEKRFNEDFDYVRRDRLHLDPQFKEDLPAFERGWHHSVHRNQENFSDFGREWQHSDQRYPDSSRGDLQHSERFQEMLNDSRRDWRHLRRSFEGTRTDANNDWNFSEQRFHERDWRVHPSNRFQGNNIDIERNWHRAGQQFHESLHDNFRNGPEERFKEILAISGRDWIKDQADYMPSDDFRRWPENQPNERNYQGFNPFQSGGLYNGGAVDGVRNFDGPSPFNNIAKIKNFNTNSLPPSMSMGPVRPSWQGFRNRRKLNVKKKKIALKKKNATAKNENKQYVVLYQYLKKFNTSLEENHVEHIKKQVIIQLEEDKKKKPERKWDPTFLSYTSESNGLHVQCQNQKSMVWLLRRRIPPIDNVQFISCNADAPIKKVKLNFLIKNCTYSPDIIIHKLDQCNRFMNLKGMHVLSCKNINGNSSLVVSTDSRIFSKIKKRNMLLRFENKMIKIFRCRKSKGKGENNKNNVGKKNNSKPADAKPVDLESNVNPADSQLQSEDKPADSQPDVQSVDVQPRVEPNDSQSKVESNDSQSKVEPNDSQSKVEPNDSQSQSKVEPNDSQPQPEVKPADSQPQPEVKPADSQPQPEVKPADSQSGVKPPEGNTPVGTA